MTVYISLGNVTVSDYNRILLFVSGWVSHYNTRLCHRIMVVQISWMGDGFIPRLDVRPRSYLNCFAFDPSSEDIPKQRIMHTNNYM